MLGLCSTTVKRPILRNQQLWNGRLSLTIVGTIQATMDSESLLNTVAPAPSFVIGRMIVVMLDTNYISERLTSLKRELSDLRVVNARYWSRSEHSPLQKSGRALNQERLVQIKRELSDLMKRCA
jgi:hypothetical protein